MGDEGKHKVESAMGTAKEKVGKATDNEQMEAEGSVDKSKGDLKQAGDKVKDAFKK